MHKRKKKKVFISLHCRALDADGIQSASAFCSLVLGSCASSQDHSGSASEVVMPMNPLERKKKIKRNE
jgi:hypothetical protein